MQALVSSLAWVVPSASVFCVPEARVMKHLSAWVTWMVGPSELVMLAPESTICTLSSSPAATTMRPSVSWPVTT